MEFGFLSMAESLRLIELQKMHKSLPIQIVQLKEAIEAEIRVAEVRTSVTGQIDKGHVDRIARLKIRLDGFYGAWAKESLENQRKLAIPMETMGKRTCSEANFLNDLFFDEFPGSRAFI